MLNRETSQRRFYLVALHHVTRGHNLSKKRRKGSLDAPCRVKNEAQLEETVAKGRGNGDVKK